MKDQPAFPVHGQPNENYSGGMTMRQYYKAAVADAAVDSLKDIGYEEAALYIGLSKDDYDGTRDWPKVLAKKCAAMADAMLAEDTAHAAPPLPAKPKENDRE